MCVYTVKGQTVPFSVTTPNNRTDPILPEAKVSWLQFTAVGICVPLFIYKQLCHKPRTCRHEQNLLYRIINAK